MLYIYCHMKGIEVKLLTLKLNKNWQVVGHSIVADALVDLAAGINSYALDIDYERDEENKPIFGKTSICRPVSWDEWITLPIRSWDFSIKSVKLEVRIPTILIAKNYEGMPMVKFGKKPSSEQIRIRDDNLCQYTGKKIQRNDISIDHVVPKSRGGKNTWENLVTTCKEINRKKGNHLNEEIGLRLIRKPVPPKPIPRYKLIQEARHADWRIFLQKTKVK
jgi:hypothetical protein